MNNSFYKNCPKCNKIIYYSRKYTLIESIDKNRKCRKCSKKGIIPSFLKDGKFSNETLQKISKTWFKKGDRPKNANFRKGKTIDEIYGVEKAKELGYFVDGYDKENNVVYEWDEKRHFNKDGSLKSKDVLRENEIKQFLKCKFIRIKDPSVLI
jgi:hypothetical protein